MPLPRRTAAFAFGNGFLFGNYCLSAATATTVVVAAASAAVVAQTAAIVVAAAREEKNKNDNPAAAISAKVKSAHSVPPIRSGCEVFRFPLRRSLHSSYYAGGRFSLHYSEKITAFFCNVILVKFCTRLLKHRAARNNFLLTLRQ